MIKSFKFQIFLFELKIIKFYSNCDILPQKVEGKELLFMSSKADVGVPGKAARGGIPICWPQFGGFDQVAQGAPKKKHGLVRTSNLWKIFKKSDDGSEVEFKLAPDAAMIKAWRGSFEIYLRVSLEATRLRLAFAVSNTAKIVAEDMEYEPARSLEFTGALKKNSRKSEKSHSKNLNPKIVLNFAALSKIVLSQVAYVFQGG